jgi:hypothetical protein
MSKSDSQIIKGNRGSNGLCNHNEASMLDGGIGLNVSANGGTIICLEDHTISNCTNK